MRKLYIKKILENAIIEINRLISENSEKQKAKQYLEEELEREAKNLQEMKSKLYEILKNFDEASHDEMKNIELFLKDTFKKIRKNLFKD